MYPPERISRLIKSINHGFDPIVGRKSFLLIGDSRAMVVAQLVEWLLPTPEVHGSNPVIGKNLY